MSRGIIEAQTLRTEQFEFEARTSDPADAQPGEYWIRTDQTSSNPDIIAQLRRQDTSGVTTAPIFASAEESNLGTDVVRGPSVVLDDGSVGFVAMTNGGGALGSPRAVTSSGTQYVSHDGLELNPIHDSVVHQYLFEDNSDTTTVTDTVGSLNGSISGATYTTTSQEGTNALDFDGSDDDVSFTSSPFSTTPSAYTILLHVSPNDSSSRQRIVHIDNSNTTAITLGIFDGKYTFAHRDGSGTFIEFSSNASVSTGSFTHVAIRWNESDNTQEFVIDGVEDATNTTGNGLEPSNNFEFGMQNDKKSYYDGIMDAVEIYNDELTTQQINDRLTATSQ